MWWNLLYSHKSEFRLTFTEFSSLLHCWSCIWGHSLMVPLLYFSSGWPFFCTISKWYPLFVGFAPFYLVWTVLWLWILHLVIFICLMASITIIMHYWFWNLIPSLSLILYDPCLSIWILFIGIIYLHLYQIPLCQQFNRFKFSYDEKFISGILDFYP